MEKDFWVKDEYVLNCTSCNQSFSFGERRHHCRSCGDLFCDACTSKRVALPDLYSDNKEQRVCENCYTTRSMRAKHASMGLMTATGDSSSSAASLTNNNHTAGETKVLEELKRLYRKSIKPLERQYRFQDFYSPLLTDADFDSKPMVLLVGQYSVGKTTFIRYLLGRDYPGCRVGVSNKNVFFLIWPPLQLTLSLFLFF